MAATDHPLKQLFTQYVTDLVSWMLGCTIRTVETLSPKLPPPTTALEADQVFKVTLADGRIIIVHIEFQQRSTHEPMHLREINYQARIALEYPGLPIVSIVIYIGRGVGSNDTGRHTVPGLDGSPTLAWSYQVFRIWDMNAEDLLQVAQTRPAVLPLIGLTRIRDPQVIGPQIAQVIAHIADPMMQQTVLELLFKLIDEKEVYMIVEDALLNDPQFANWPYVERMREIKDEGIQLGMQQGIEQGVMRNLRDNIIEIVRLRFPNSPNIVDHVQQYLDTVSDEARLRELFAAAVQAETSAAIAGVFNGAHN